MKSTPSANDFRNWFPISVLLGGVVLLLILATSTILQAQTASSSDRVESILGKMSLQEKIDYIGRTGFAIRAMPSLQLPAFEMSDGPLGVRSNSRFASTVYAAGIGLAATWNPNLATRVGGGIGRDARARGLHFMLGPGQPSGSRCELPDESPIEP